jgi:endonuclease YncB( thermonuclease family)
MRVLLGLVACAILAAAESAPVRVLRVIDGDTLVVASTVGGLDAGTAVRLRWIDCREMDETGGTAARDALLALAPVGSDVVLIVNSDSAPLDGHGRVLALVRLGDGSLAQERLIAAGWSCYWQRYGTAPGPWHESLQAAHAAAQAARAGTWQEHPEWMAGKAAERWEERRK